MTIQSPPALLHSDSTGGNGDQKRGMVKYCMGWGPEGGGGALGLKDGSHD